MLDQISSYIHNFSRHTFRLILFQYTLFTDDDIEVQKRFIDMYRYTCMSDLYELVIGQMVGVILSVDVAHNHQ